MVKYSNPDTLVYPARELMTMSFPGLAQFFDRPVIAACYIVLLLAIVVSIALTGAHISNRRYMGAILCIAVAFTAAGITWQFMENTEKTPSDYTNMDTASFMLPFMIAGPLFAIVMIDKILKSRRQRWEKKGTNDIQKPEFLERSLHS